LPVYPFQLFKEIKLPVKNRIRYKTDVGQISYNAFQIKQFNDQEKEIKGTNNRCKLRLKICKVNNIFHIYRPVAFFRDCGSLWLCKYVLRRYTKKPPDQLKLIGLYSGFIEMNYQETVNFKRFLENDSEVYQYSPVF
jgi:hypothetical protein